LPDNLKTKLTK